MVELTLSSRNEFNPGANAIAVALRALKGKFEPVIAFRTVIHPNFRRTTKSSYNDVEFSVMIEITKGGSTVAAWGLVGQTRLRS